ncbi:MAG: MnhB domain-containing protein [Chloroflexota bacterium]
MIIEVVGPRLLGPAVVLAIAIIVKGYADVGDAFSAAVIVALAIGLRYVSLGRERAEQGLPILRHASTITAIGLLLALGVGFLGVVRGDPPFTHLPAAGETVITIGSLELITAVAFDIGLFLLVTGALVVLMHHLAELVAGRDQ